MGLPAKCMHFVGSPGWRGGIKITRGTKNPFGAPSSTTNGRCPQCHFGCAESAQGARGSCPKTGQEKSTFNKVLSGA